MIRVLLPYHLQNLAQVGREVRVALEAPVTLGALLDTLEAAYPVLRGTIRDQVTDQRRPFIRYFAVGLDFSLEPLDTPLPEPVAQGIEPLRIVGAMAGG